MPGLLKGAVVDEAATGGLGHAIETAPEGIGRANLYGGVVDCSEPTLQAAVAVANVASSLGIEVPDPEPYLISPFSEAHGWGEPMNLEN